MSAFISAVTVLEEPSGAPINKVVTRTPQGIVKGMASNSGEYIARTLAAPDLETFAAIVADLGDSPHKTLMLGEFMGAPDDRPFLVVPEATLAKRCKLDPNDRDAVLGFHEHDGTPIVARLKENVAFGGWLLFDRDTVDGMPDELAELTSAGWLAAMDTLLPGFKASRRLILPSTSSRIAVDGRPLDSQSCHVFVQVADPQEIPRVWGQLLPKAMVTSLDHGVTLGFMRHKYARDDRSKVVAHQPWSIFDPSTGQSNRLVFDGAPVVRGDGLAVMPATFETHDGDPLDLSAFADLAAAQIDQLERSTKLRVKLERTVNGAGARVTGASITSQTLSMDLQVETRRGWFTVEELVDQAAGHTRCQAPFRESSSWAAYFNVHEDGQPFIYDSGINTKYVLPDELVAGDGVYDLSHDGLALDMGRRWRADARHVALWGRWLFWTGARWEPDERLAHMTRCRDYLRRRADDLVRDTRAGKIAWDAKDPIKAAEAVAKQLRSEPMRSNVTSMARSNPELVATVAQWDANLTLLGTAGGTVDLRNGELRETRPADFITKLTSVAPAPPGTSAPIWEGFLKRIFRHDPELAPFIQRAIGYSLLGEIRDHVVLFGWGQGGNGKGVLLNTVSRILGDYAAVAPSDLLLATNSDRHPCDMAMLRGARFVTCQELGPNRAWDEPKLKSLTGGDPITARFMRQDFFTYQPQFTLWVAGNHKPSFRGVDEAIKRRVLLAPFLQVIPPEERDLDLPAKLRAEHPAILRWMIDGCLAYQRDGLNPPASALAATKAYLDAEDTLGQWLDERCIQHPKIDWTPLKALYADWSAWCVERGQRPGTARSLSKSLDERGHERQRRAPGEGFCGVGLANVGNVDSPYNTRMGARADHASHIGRTYTTYTEDPDEPGADDLGVDI